MKVQSDDKLFRAEREDTDKSLVAERAKATQSLNVANVKSQGRTDEIVKDERTIADQHTASSRVRHDQDREADQMHQTGAIEKVRIAEERRRTDQATDLERSRIDKVILAERTSSSKMVAKILERERIATDRHLLVERNTTDAEHFESTTLFAKEVASHKVTKGALTSREQFLAIVSHDLKNPMGAVRAYADLILEDAGGTPLGPETKKYVEAIQRNADISLRLISDLLDLERISSGKLTLDFSRIKAAAIVDAALMTFLPRAQELGISLSSSTADADIELHCDPDRILQVLTNLIGNAIKFAPRGARVEVEVSQRNSGVEFSVKDNGPGIPKEKHAAIFERLAQLSSSDRTGLGLGLFIAKTLVEAHRGVLSLESAPGIGSRFFFTLPHMTAT